MRRFLCLGLFVLFACQSLRAQTTYLDFSRVANKALECDSSGKGGCYDQGINDLGIYPPIQAGENVRNGYHFLIPDPAKNDRKTVLVLCGPGRESRQPSEATVDVANIRAHFLYVLQNSEGSTSNASAHVPIAVYTVHYQDGSESSITIRDGIEIRPWWTGAWYDNSGAAAWPVFMGRNPVSMKYNQFIGVWAMQWQNPTPDKAITSITFKSLGIVTPAIFAATLSDDDYFKSPHSHDDFKRPADVPEGFFDDKLRFEQRQLLAEMIQRKMAVGVRKVEMIRPNLVAVTIDSLLSGGAGQGESAAAALQSPEHFTIESNQDGDFHGGVHPSRVGRQTDPFDIVDIGRFDATKLFWHTYYLALPVPLHDGSHYKVTIAGLPAGATDSIEFNYSSHDTISQAIKVNQASYAISSTRRYAYLGWWAGDLGAVDFSDVAQFSVINEATGQTALNGAIVLRKAGDKISGEDVYEMDLAGLKDAGRYHIVVPGLGRSFSFSLGGDETKLDYVTTMRGFLYQRCGCELSSEVTDGYPRHADQVLNYQDGRLVGGPIEKYEGDKLVVQNAPRYAGEATRAFHGGYHDAGNYTVYYYHMEATSKTLTAFEEFPGVFKDRELRLPESGNGVPDVLNEAAWSLKFYAENQQPDGAVPSGRGNDEDYTRQAWPEEGAKLFGALPPFGTLPPCCPSSCTFAAVAAQYSRLVRPFDAAQADAFLNKARSAYDWAKSHTTTEWDRKGISNGRIQYKVALAWAAEELFNTTGESRYNDNFAACCNDPQTWDADWKVVDRMPFYWWPYANSHQPSVNKAIQSDLIQRITKAADNIVRAVDSLPYRMGKDGPQGGWGNTVGGGHYGDPCLLAYFLTHKQKYLDTASLCADYQLGANPLSRCFITGMGSRPPLHAELRAPLYNAQGVPAPGIPVYGPGGADDAMGGYPKIRPLWRVYCDVRMSDEINSEFTIDELGYSAMLHMNFWGLQQR